ncbi:MAG: hypothetical protein ACK4N5_06225 [Myxococcales bacterium]
MTLRTVLLALSLLALACGGGNFDAEEERLITDAEIDELGLGVATSELMATEAPAASGHDAIVRLSWGYLGGKRHGTWVDWSGGLEVAGGELSLVRTLFFDRHDRLDAERSDGQIRWRSKTGPHFDGLIVRVRGGADSTLRIRTPLFEKDLSLASLQQGREDHFVVTGEKHEVSLTSIPASACGLALGYHRPSRQGWLGFAGRLARPDGALLGNLRFRAEDGLVEARLKKGGELVATGSGTLVEGREVGSFSIALRSTDGAPLGTVRGIFRKPSYSPRGFFQAAFDCP